MPRSVGDLPAYGGLGEGGFGGDLTGGGATVPTSNLESARLATLFYKGLLADFICLGRTEVVNTAVPTYLPLTK